VAVPVYIENGEREPLACAVFDISAKGARIDAADIALSESFVLILKLNSYMRRRCKVVWRSGYTAGILFVLWNYTSTTSLDLK
jgi:hypothetical protein